MPNKDIRYIGVRVVPEVHDKLRYIAKYEGRTINGQSYYLIQECIRNFERKHGTITDDDLKKSDGA